jgi:hypothetical protein
MNLGRFQPCVDFRIDPYKVMMLLQVIYAFSQRAVAHDDILTTECTARPLAATTVGLLKEALPIG